MRTHVLTACPACGAADGQPFDYHGTPLQRCPACRVVYGEAVAEADDVYDDEYFTGAKGDFGYDARHEAFRAYLATVAATRMDFIESVAGRGGSGRLLDVGCGTADLLLEARSRGWEVVGLDLVPAAVTEATGRGLDVRLGTMDDAGLELRSFDVVAATHVLEHLTDAVGFLRQAGAHARSGGLVVVEVPNWGSAQRRVDRGRWMGLRPLEHVGHYTPRTLAATFRRAGLDPVRTATPSHLADGQTVHERAMLLGLSPIAARLARHAPVVERNGQQVPVPGRRLARAIGVVGAIEDRAGLGAALLLAGRVR